MNNLELFGKRIRELRKTKSLTQEQLAELIERSQRQVSLIEVGNCFPSCVTLLRLAEVFNCSVNDLFDFELLDEGVNIKEKLTLLIDVLPEDKLKTLYVIGKNI